MSHYPLDPPTCDQANEHAGFHPIWINSNLHGEREGLYPCYSLCMLNGCLSSDHVVTLKQEVIPRGVGNFVTFMDFLLSKYREKFEYCIVISALCTATFSDLLCSPEFRYY